MQRGGDNKSNTPDQKTLDTTLLSPSRKLSDGALIVPRSSLVLESQNPKALVHLDKSETLLFPHDPVVSDIRQGLGIGDCYLMATLASILQTENGPQTIQKMMRDNKSEKSITVQLFDPLGQPVNRKIQKSVRLNPLKRARGENSLWVNMMEKAYTIHALNSSYKVLGDGGHQEVTMQILLGQPAKRLAISLPRKEADMIRLTKVLTPFFVSESKNLEHKDFEGLNLSSSEAKSWTTFIDNNNLSDKWHALLVSKNTNTHTLRYEELCDLLMKNTQKQTQEQILIKNKIMAWVMKQKLLPGKRGSGIYSNSQNEIFDEFKRLIDDKLFVTVSTKKQIKESNVLPKAVTGESLSNGLVGMHAYSVIGYKEEGGRKIVIVQNPWGWYGRNLVSNDRSKTLSAKPKTDSISEIDLSDFTKRFESIEYSGCFVKRVDADKKDTIITKFPCYLLANDGLYFATEYKKIIPINKQKAKLFTLRDSIKPSDDKPKDYRILSRDEQLTIFNYTGHTAIKSDIQYCVLAKDSQLGKFSSTLGYILASDGLYKVDEIGKILTEDDRIIKDRENVKYLWSLIGSEGEATYDDDTILLDNTIQAYINQELDQFSSNPFDFDQIVDAEWKIHENLMQRYSINMHLIKSCIEYISKNSIDQIEKIFSVLREKQQIGLIKLIKFNQEFQKNPSISEFLKVREAGLYAKYPSHNTPYSIGSSAEKKGEISTESKEESALIRSKRELSLEAAKSYDTSNEALLVKLSANLTILTKFVASEEEMDADFICTAITQQIVYLNELNRITTLFPISDALLKKTEDHCKLHKVLYENIIKNFTAPTHDKNIKALATTLNIAYTECSKTISSKVEKAKKAKKELERKLDIYSERFSLFSSKEENPAEKQARAIINQGKFIRASRKSDFSSSSSSMASPAVEIRDYVEFNDQDTRDFAYQSLVTLGYGSSIRASQNNKKWIELFNNITVVKGVIQFTYPDELAEPDVISEKDEFIQDLLSQGQIIKVDENNTNNFKFYIKFNSKEERDNVIRLLSENGYDKSFRICINSLTIEVFNQIKVNEKQEIHCRTALTY